MSKLLCKTKRDDSPNGKPRVYFCCHREDFGQYFDPICKELFRFSNCAVYYYASDADAETDPDYALDLGQMRLFVMPVTTRMLMPNRALDKDFRFAQANHIPVLPLMQESGLEQAFNLVCGNLQFLDKNLQDSTAIPYEQKLKTFLDSVLIGDEQAKRIRAAFDARVFLSYRKMDRRYAQTLMRLIHANPLFRDVAIWYDEFLTPGEDFNDTIADALEKCDLFAMAVTPNLLIDGNYVITHEYPRAADQFHKPILAAEMLPTDRDKLRRVFPAAGACVDAADPEALSAALGERLRHLAIEECERDPAHNFFIGLAYLGGVDVEVDKEKAVELITGAAQAGLPEAMEKLAFMYKNGDGVERDYHAYVRWLKAMAEHDLQEFNKNRSPEDGTACFDNWLFLGDAQTELGLPAQAQTSYEQCVALAKRLRSQEGESGFCKMMTLCHSRLGYLARTQGQMKKAAEHGAQELQYANLLAQAKGTPEAQEDLADAYDSLSKAHQDANDLDSAWEYGQKALNIREQLVKSDPSDEKEHALSFCYCQLGDICRDRGQEEAALSYYLDFYLIHKAITDKGLTVTNAQDLGMACQRLASTNTSLNRKKDAEPFYLRNLELQQILVKKTGSVQHRRELAMAHSLLGDHYRCDSDDDERALQHQLQALNMLEALAKETHTMGAKMDLSRTCYDIAWLVMTQDTDASQAYFERALSCIGDLPQAPEVLEHRAGVYNALGSMHEALGNLKQAEKYLDKALDTNQQLLSENTPSNILLQRYSCLRNLGDLYLKRLDPFDIESAEKSYIMSCGILYQLEETTQMHNVRELLVDACQRIGRIYHVQGKLNDAIEAYEEALNRAQALDEEADDDEFTPDVAHCHELLSHLHRLLRNHEDAAFHGAAVLEIREYLAWEETEEAILDLANALDLLGEAYLDAGHLDEAQIQFQKALDLRKALKRSPMVSIGRGISFRHLGDLCLARGDRSGAMLQYDNARKRLMAEVGDDPLDEVLYNLALAQLQLAQLYLEAGQLADADKHGWAAVENGNILFDRIPLPEYCYLNNRSVYIYNAIHANTRGLKQVLDACTRNAKTFSVLPEFAALRDKIQALLGKLEKPSVFKKFFGLFRKD